MPLIALKPSTGARIDILDFDNVRVELDCSDLVCPMEDCRGRMIPVHGRLVSPHFRHGAGECATQYRSSEPRAGGESAHHRMGKRVIAREVTEWFKARGIEVRVDFEVAIPAARRIADVMVTLPDGEKVVYECQLAAINVEELKQRTDDYLAAGHACFWYFGRRADTPTNRDWAVHHYGGVHVLTFAETADGDPSRGPVAVAP